MPEFIRDEKGKWVGSIYSDSTKRTFLDEKGRLVGREFDNKTFDSKGAFKGYGNQGKRLFGDKCK